MHWLKGCCPKGDSCKYYHDFLHNWKTQLCEDIPKCKYGVWCNRAHTHETIDAVNKLYLQSSVTKQDMLNIIQIENKYITKISSEPTIKQSPFLTHCSLNKTFANVVHPKQKEPTLIEIKQIKQTLQQQLKQIELEEKLFDIKQNPEKTYNYINGCYKPTYEKQVCPPINCTYIMKDNAPKAFYIEDIDGDYIFPDTSGKI